jgi:uncharacterized membrane protein
MKSIEQLQEEKGTFSIGLAIGDGWNLVSKHLIYFIGAGIITFIIGIGVGMVPFIGDLANNLILSPCFMASAIYITWRISKGFGWADFGDMFKGFNYASPVLVATLIHAVIGVGIAALCLFSFLPQLIELYEAAQGPDVIQNQKEIEAIVKSILLNGQNILLFCLFMLALLLLSAVWAFKLHFIVVYNMQAWPAMELSRRICIPNLFKILALLIVLGLIIVVSAIPCGIGLLFSLPLSIGATYSAFAQITSCDSAEEINKDMFDFMNGANNGRQL